MKKINQIDTSNCTSILYSDSPSFSGIIAGESKGKVWVDHLEKPTLALVYSKAVGGFSILGDPEDETVYSDFKDFLQDELFIELKNSGTDFFEFSVESNRTKNHMLRMFSDKCMNQEDEYYYRKSTVGSILEIDEYQIKNIDSKFIERLESGKYNNSDLVSSRILGSWDSYDQFINRSVGIVAVNGSSIVAVLIGSGRYQDVIPIDIMTNAEHRKKGLASILTQHFVNKCVDRRLIAQWNCVESNIASRNTVEKAGFEFLKKKPFYWFEI